MNRFKNTLAENETADQRDPLPNFDRELFQSQGYQHAVVSTHPDAALLAKS